MHEDPGAGAGPVAHAAQPIRRATSTVLHTHRDFPGLADVAARIHALADHLETRVCSTDDRMMQMDTVGRIVRYSPVSGSRNAIAAPLHLCRVGVGIGVEGTVRFSAAHQGPPGVVHAGVAAMILDVALADANMVAGVPGMTAGLTLRYHRPIPLRRDLIVRARHASGDGRKAVSRGEIWLGSDLCVSAEGLFIVPREGVPRDWCRPE